MAFNPLNTLSYSLYSNLPSTSPHNGSSSLFTQGDSHSPQELLRHISPALRGTSENLTNSPFCVFTSAPNFYSSLYPEKDTVKETYTFPYNNPITSTTQSTSPLYKLPHEHWYSTNRFNLIAQFLASNAGFFAKRTSKAHPAGTPSTAGALFSHASLGPSLKLVESGSPLLCISLLSMFCKIFLSSLHSTTAPLKHILYTLINIHDSFCIANLRDAGALFSLEFDYIKLDNKS